MILLFKKENIVMHKDELIKLEIQKIINKVSNKQIETNICFTLRQLDILSQLNEFCLNKILNDNEVENDPRKISYKTNEEFKFALTALCLSVILTDHRSPNKYNKEFLENNIFVESPSPNIINLKFGKIENYIIEKAINAELIFDWMIYRDFEGRGIYALINEKMDGLTLDEYNAGGCPIYEFARFQRKYNDYKKRKETLGKESAQEAFRNAVAQQIATQITTQQLLEGKDPMEFVNILFGKPDFENSINEITKSFAKNKDRPLQISHKKKNKNKS